MEDFLTAIDQVLDIPHKIERKRRVCERPHKHLPPLICSHARKNYFFRCRLLTLPIRSKFCTNSPSLKNFLDMGSQFSAFKPHILRRCRVFPECAPQL